MQLFLALLPLAFSAERIEGVEASGPITIDGHLDEPDWERAAVVTDFHSYKPKSGVPHLNAEARILYDEHALYVAFRVPRIEGTPLASTLVPRDETRMHDWVGVVLDTFQDGQRAFAFRSNPAGVQADGIFTEGSDLWMQDLSWDTVFESEGQVTEAGYEVEMAIPWRSLRYPSTPSQEWGIVLIHFTPQPWEIHTWPELSRGTFGALSQAGVLGPFSAPEPRIQLEIQPTLTAFADPTDLSGFAADPGLGIKAGLSSSLTADLAINPDFSQIEADAAQVTANVKYPLFYEEKRPFFLEGADLFETPVSVLYSRSIVDPLGAYKVTGRVGELALGWMGAYDQRPAPSSITMDYASGESLPGWDESLVEEATSVVHLGRFRYNVHSGNSVGLVLADKELLLPDDRVLYNRLGGMDTAWNLGEHSRLGFQALGSQTQMEDETLNGSAGALYLVTETDRIASQLSQGWISPGFRAETGFLEEVGRAAGGANAHVNLTDLGALRYLGPGASLQWSFTPEGEPVLLAGGPMVDAMVGTKLYVNTRAVFSRERYLGQDFQLWTSRGFTSYSPTPTSDINLMWNVGTSPHYAASSSEDLYRGISATGILMLSEQFFGRIRVDYQFTGQHFYKTLDEAPIYTTLIHRGQVGSHFTRELALRLIAEWNTTDDTVDSSALFSYQVNFGTVFYLGYTGHMSTEDSEATAHEIFAKLSWLFRP